jgi:inosose dehydratase
VLTRRTFLARAAVASATTAAIGAVAARRLSAATSATREPPLSLGFSLYGMKTLPLSRALAECARIGYRNVELALLAGFPTDPAKLTSDVRRATREACAGAGQRVSALMVNLSLTANEAARTAHLGVLRQACEFAREIDATAPPVVETVLGGKPATWDADRADMVARLREWDAVAREHAITLAVKAHVGSGVNSPERLLWLLREAGVTQTAVAYDHSHFGLAGLSIDAGLAPLASRTRFVHLKDAAGDSASSRFLLPGEGRADFAAIFRALVAAGYRRAVVVEVSGQIFNRPGYDPVAAAESSYAALAPLLPK